jgi:hypothetical protein
MVIIIIIIKSIKVVLISFTLMLKFAALSSAALMSISSRDELTLSFSEKGEKAVLLTYLKRPKPTPKPKPAPDTPPPAGIAALQNNTYEQTYINWSWTDPEDNDLSMVMIYLDGSFKANVTKGVQFYNATDLIPAASYTISTQTVDSWGNINQTWINHTALAASAPTPTPAPVPAQLTISSSDGMNLTLSAEGNIAGIGINNSFIPLLAAQGGFSFREVLVNALNLIANSGFESGAAAPLNWSFVTSSGSTPEWDTVSRSGARSIKISIPGTTDSRSGYPKSEMMEAEQLAYYTLSAWLKAQGSGGTNAPAVSHQYQLSLCLCQHLGGLRDVLAGRCGTFVLFRTHDLLKPRPHAEPGRYGDAEGEGE